MTSIFLFAVCLLVSFGDQVGADDFPQSNTPRAITPTAPGQIGINPVDFDVPTAINTDDFSYSGSGLSLTSHWLTKGTDWMTEGPSTTTVSNTQTTITTTAYSVKISTISNPGTIAGIAAGDLYVELPPEVASRLQDLATKACGGGVKRSLTKRQGSCAATPQGYANAVDAYANAAANDDLLGNLLIDPFQHVPKINMDEVTRAVAAIKWGGGLVKSTVLQNKVAVATVLFAVFAKTGVIPLQAKIEKPLQDAQGTYDSTVPPATSTSTSGCVDPSATVNCANKNKCDGDQDHKCQNGKYKDCSCRPQVKPMYHGASAKEYSSVYNDAQGALEQIESVVGAAISSPWCHNGFERTFDPQYACQCSGQTYSTYSTAVVTTDDPNLPKIDPAANDNFWDAGCPWISGDPDLTAITISHWTAPPQPEPTQPSPAANPTPTPQSKCMPNNTPGWSASYSDTIRMADAFCRRKACQEGNQDISGNWPGSCAWVPYQDVKRNAISFTVSKLKDDVCQKATLKLDAQKCFDSLKAAIECDNKSGPDDQKQGGWHEQDCLHYQFGVAPYANSGYPCVGTYNGPDKPGTIDMHDKCPIN